MRARDVKFHDHPHKDRPTCGWTNCKEPAKYHATFQIRAGRTQAGTFVDRVMGLCGPDLIRFRDKWATEGSEQT